MSNPGEWITFDELCRRVPGRSASTMRRYVKAKLISSRQLGGPRGRLQFNWRTVQGELAVIDTPAVNDGAARALAALEHNDPVQFTHELREVLTLLRAVAKRLRIEPEKLKGEA